ncbi:Tannase/feruloyl esterase [Aspergillus pseudoustus]|uniref:Carboxylic ester hydrolase n=1 Tax=Aspergillus pseudoustus TaxID=1810923 RepID=A0ABR4KW05_9EURO
MLLSAKAALLPGLALASGCLDNVQLPTLPEARVLDITSSAVSNLTIPSNLTGIIDAPAVDICNVTVTLTHPGDDDHVYVTIWLPRAEEWNGRYAATGGGGLAAGYEHNMLAPVLSGFAASSTDGGITLNHTVNPQSGRWISRANGTVNTPLLINLAYRSVHDMAVVSKQILEQYYNVAPSKSYFTGCSQGGRQGYASAAHYPEDFDGILAVAPALSSELIGPANFWPWIVMRDEEELVPACVFRKFEEAIIQACDPVDGATDGLISHANLLRSCAFHPTYLVGKIALCEGSTYETITAKHARIVQKILEGPRDENGERIWYGLTLGAPFSGIADTVLLNGTMTPKPFVASAGWLQGMLRRNVTNLFAITESEYLAVFETSIEIGSDLFGLDTLDLTNFQASGAKLLSWVGLSDEAINPLNLLDFYDSVRQTFGDDGTVDDFYRLFTAPGVGHCMGGHGPQPINAMPALTLPTKPTHLNTTAREAPRYLCRYPKKPIYMGGDVHDGSSFRCLA